jgi:group II intron reverse transcriptase/maturase
MTPGTDSATLDGMNLTYLKGIQKKVRAGKFQFPPARRVNIPKPGRPNETRPLTIVSPRDKILQKAIQLVMEEYYNPKFLETSHGFRPGMGTHTAIQYVEAKFNSCKYIIEADFSNAFPSINHEKLLKIISRDCKDEKLISLIRSVLKAGHMDEFGKIHNHLEIGTPQGSILSPILCNIFLHELDIFMEELKLEINTGDRRKKSTEYNKIANRVKYLRKKGMVESNITEYNQLLKKMITIPSLKYDEDYVRILYIRYADDFIIGVEGSYNIAESILNRVKEFVKELNLNLNESKTGIIDITEKPCIFLGYSLQGPYKKGSSRGIETLIDPTSKRLITRRKKERMGLHLNMDKVLKRLKNNGFIVLRKDPKTGEETIFRGTFKGNLVNLDHADILRYYSSVIRGFYNYYKIVRNMSKVARII